MKYEQIDNPLIFTDTREYNMWMQIIWQTHEVCNIMSARVKGFEL